MQGINRVTLLGNLGQDPEFKEVGADRVPMCRFRLATTERNRAKDGEWHETTTWHNVVAWNHQATVIRDRATKGILVLVEGRLVARSYDTKEGDRRYITEVLALFVVVVPKPETL